MPARRVEASIERTLVSACRKIGLRALKLNLQGSTGWPDRLVLVPGGRPLLVELKRAGELPRPLQEERMRELRVLGYSVVVVTGENGLRHLIQLLQRLKTGETRLP